VVGAAKERCGTRKRCGSQGAVGQPRRARGGAAAHAAESSEWPGLPDAHDHQRGLPRFRGLGGAGKFLTGV